MAEPGVWKVAAAAGGAALLAWAAWPRHKSSITIPRYSMTSWPSASTFWSRLQTRVLFSLHWEILKYVVLEASQGSEDILDRGDVMGMSPYVFSEVAPGLWCVEYCFQMDKAAAKFILLAGKQPEEEFLRGVDGERREVLKRDLQRCREVNALPREEFARGRGFKEGLQFTTRMYVVRLQTGGLLLYSPVKCGKELCDWIGTIKGMGEVEVILSPSAAHHFFVKSAAEAFPKACVVAGDSAGVKLAKGGLQPHINYSEPVGRQMTEALLRDSCIVRVCEGCPNQECVLFHVSSGTALCCDLIYGKHDKERGTVRSDGAPKSKWDLEAERDPIRWMGRIFRRLWVERSPNGTLPIYRYWLLDAQTFMPLRSPRPDQWTAERFKADIEEVVRVGDALKVKRLVSCHIDEPLTWPHAVNMLKANWDFLFDNA